MEVIKIVAIGIIICLCASMLKSVSPQFSLVVIIAGSVVLILYILNYFTQIFALFNNIVVKAGISTSLFGTLIKIMGVGYIVEFGASVCTDSGYSSIGDKIVLGGKIIIFTMALPLISDMFNLLLELLGK